MLVKLFAEPLFIIQCLVQITKSKFERINRVSTGPTKSLKEWSDLAETFRIGFFGPENHKQLFIENFGRGNFCRKFYKKGKNWIFRIFNRLLRPYLITNVSFVNVFLLNLTRLFFSNFSNFHNLEFSKIGKGKKDDFVDPPPFPTF